MTSSMLVRETLWHVPFLAALVVAILVWSTDAGQAAEPPSRTAILQELRSFATTGSVLYLAAHPDDENTQVITYMARGRGYRTAYLSLTRGDGGQNLLGPQLGETLGVARTQELLAARRLDGGRQYFTRAKDFGYSKNAEETLTVWDRQAVVGDMVRVIREFRPDVIITRFSPKPTPTHGHHTASAVLAVEAFNLAGDPAAFPEQLRELRTWQARRIVHNVGRGPNANPGAGVAIAGWPADVPDGPGVVKIDVGVRDPVTGESFASIAARSRGMHKTQGFDVTGPPLNEGSRVEAFVHLAGDMATRDLFAGLDTTWARFPGGDEIARSIDEAIASFNAQDVAASVPALLAIHRRLAALLTDPVVADKRAQLDRIIQACIGLAVDSVVDRAEVAGMEPAAGEDGQATEEAPLVLREQAVRPLDGGSQRLLARIGVAVALEQVEALRELLEELVGTEDRGAGGGELDGERDGLEQAAGIGAAAPRDVERRAVIDRRAHDRQSQGYIDRVAEARALDHRQTLVVVHRQHGVELAESRGHEGCVRGYRPAEFHPGAA